MDKKSDFSGLSRPASRRSLVIARAKAGGTMRYVELPLFALALLVAPHASYAEKLPRPAVDYAVEGTMTSGRGSQPGTIRHGGGKMRFDIDDAGQQASIFVDLAARKATVVTHRDGKKLAIQMEADNAGEAGNFLERDAKRLGDAQIAGEACVDYEFEGVRGRTIRGCFTTDGIALRMRDLTRDRVFWEALRVTRAPQSAALFVVPTDAEPMQIPRTR
jgi:hypothetical protein